MLTCGIVRNAFTFTCQEEIFGLVKAASQGVQNSDRKQVVRKDEKMREKNTMPFSPLAFAVAILNPVYKSRISPSLISR